MDTTDIKNIGLTVADIELINKALDHYTTKDSASRALSSMVGSILTGDNPVQKAAFERAEADYNRKKDRELDNLKEDVRLIQGKVIMLKRLLIESNLMDSIKNYPPPPITKILAIKERYYDAKRANHN